MPVTWSESSPPEGALSVPLLRHSIFISGEGTAFTSLSPTLDQTFFIGDGQTGDHKGVVQTFIVPSGARKLWLGISDAPFYNGSPGAYSDNVGTYTVAVRVHNDTCP